MIPPKKALRSFVTMLGVSVTLTGCGHLKRRSDIQALSPAAAQRLALLKAYPLASFNQALVFLREGADQDPGHEAEFCGLNPTDALNLMIPLKELRAEKLMQAAARDSVEGLNCRADCAKKFTWVCRSELLEYLKKTATPIDE